MKRLSEIEKEILSLLNEADNLLVKYPHEQGKILSISFLMSLRKKTKDTFAFIIQYMQIRQ